MSLPPIHIPWASPPVGAAEAEAAREAVASTRLSMGRSVAEFEASMATYAGRRHAVAVSNGTDALEIAIRLLEIGPGDEVLVSAMSYIATVNCIVRAGAVPVFCDVVPTTLNIDPRDISEKLTSRSRAVIVADYCGFAVDYDLIEPLCEKAGLQLIVDGAQSIGTYHRGRSALGIGAIATTSFHSAKIMTTGEGGMVLFDDDDHREMAHRFRGQGEVPGRKYIHDTLGFNHRITDVQGAIGLVQLGRLPEFCAARSRSAHRYLSLLARCEHVTTLHELPETIPAWFSMPILVDDRDSLARYVRGKGIETRSLYPIPTYRQEIPGYPRGVSECPAAEKASASVLNLPMFADLTADQIDEVVARVIEHMDPA